MASTAANNTHLMITRDFSDTDLIFPKRSQCFFSMNCGNKEFYKAENLTPSLPKFSSKISVIGSCNGLLCLSDYTRIVALWNPATKEYVRLPNMIADANHPSINGRFSSDEKVNRGLQKQLDRESSLEILQSIKTLMGFGCYSTGEEQTLYKVVKLAFSSKDDMNFMCSELMVYTVGKKTSWRVIEDRSPTRPLYINGQTQVVHLNGVVHWIGLVFDDELMKPIIGAFDLKKEILGEVAWPELLPDNYYGLSIGEIHGCLSVCSQNPNEAEIWVMKNYGEKESWTKEICIRQNIVFSQPFTCRVRGKTLLGRISSEKLLLYDSIKKKDRHVIDLPLTGIPTIRFVMITVYQKTNISIASLMSIVGEREDGAVIKKETTSRIMAKDGKEKELKNNGVNSTKRNHTKSISSVIRSFFR